MAFRLLEGEPLLHSGIVYLVKGYQHPPGYVIAQPRYSLLLGRKLSTAEAQAYVEYSFWDCLKLEVPVLSLESTYAYKPFSLPHEVFYVKEALESLLDVELSLTGSAIIASTYRDLDFVVYGAIAGLAEKISSLISKGVFSRNESLLVSEYLEKHSKNMSLRDYLYLKKNTVLHFSFMGFHVNLKLVEYKQGYPACLDEVINAQAYTGRVLVEKPLNPHVLPARYEAKLSNGIPVILETFREVYAELSQGEYYVVNARLEERRSGTYLVPDHGFLTHTSA